MIRINLLPYRPARREKLFQKQAIIWAATLVVGLIVAFFVDSLLTGSILELQESQKKNATTITTLDTKLGELAKLKERKDALEKRIQVIDILQKRSELTIKLLDSVTRSVPEKAWLTQLTTKDFKVKLVGKAESNSDVATYLRNLKQTSYFSSVELDQVKQVELDLDSSLGGPTEGSKNAPKSSKKEDEKRVIQVVEFRIEGAVNLAGLEIVVDDPKDKKKKKKKEKK